MKRLLNRMDHVSEFRSLVENKFTHLTELKKKDKRLEFEQIIANLLPRIRRYIGRRLTSAKENELISQNTYKVDDFVKELYDTAYKEVHEVKDQKFFESWLVKKVDQLINNAITEVEIDEFFMRNINDYTEEEWETMLERFGSESLIDQMDDEVMNEKAYKKYVYTLQDVYYEEFDRSIINDLNDQLSDEMIHRHIDFVSHRLPRHLRTAFTLIVCQHFKPKEVAHIHQITVDQVIKNINKAKEMIRKSFEHRYVTKEFLQLQPV